MPEAEIAPEVESQHQQALQLFTEKHYERAAALLADLIKKSESSELWNDWATAKLMCNQPGHSEQGYRRALDLNPESSRAAANLGILLASQGRFAEALPLLEKGLRGCANAEGEQLRQVLALCRSETGEAPKTDTQQPMLQMAEVIRLQSDAIAALARRIAAVEAASAASPNAVSFARPPARHPEASQVRPGPFQNMTGAIDLNLPYLFSIKNGRPVLALVNERIVEVPFAHRHLPYPFEGKVLDVGSRESQMSFELASLGFETWALDIREARVQFPGVRHLRADIRSAPLKSKSFDIAVALSTLEHIGLAAYGDVSRDEQGDFHALQEIHRVLKFGAKLMLTVPFGVRGRAESYRVYDHDALLGWLARCGFEIEIEDYWLQQGMRWYPVHWSDAETMDSTTQGAKAVACVVARRGAEDINNIKSFAALTSHPETGRKDRAPGAAAPMNLEKGPEALAGQGGGEVASQPAKTPSTPKPGVLFRGLIYGGSGYGEENWTEAVGLADNKIPVQLLAMGDLFDSRGLLPEASRQKLKTLQRQLVDMPKSVIYQASPAGIWDLDFTGRWRIGRTMFETDRIPLGFRERCNAMDEVWLPSRFNMETFAAAGVDERKLKLMLPGIDTVTFHPGAKPLTLPGKRAFNFLSVFDWQLRKGYDVLLKAYLGEFKADEDVALFLKVSQANDAAARLEDEIRAFIECAIGMRLEKSPPVILIKQFIPLRDMARLYAAADCFVLPTRGEGYGRPFLEALACQLPVIATRWSGQLDFLNSQNSDLIDISIAPAPDDVDLEIFAGHCWAEPDHEHLRHLMRQAYRCSDDARRKAALGREGLVREYAWDQVIPRWVNEFQRLLN